MAPQARMTATSSTAYATKTQHYLKVKKPLLERQRRARMNQCLDTLKTLVAEFQGDDAILRLDKAEMLEAALLFMRKELVKQQAPVPPVPMDSYKNGYMNAVSEISRVMACTSAMSVDIGKTVMTHLGIEFQHMLQADQQQVQQQQQTELVFCQQSVSTASRPVSPASSGYHSDAEDSSTQPAASMWRPW